jgi:AraC family transcriptional activator of pobA
MRCNRHDEMETMTSAPAVPIYKLFGEHAPWPMAEMLHCETIEARGRLHNWQITPHQHNGLFQLLYLRHGHAKVQVDGRHFTLEGGGVLIVPQMVVHGFEFRRNAVGIVLTVAQPLVVALVGESGDGMAPFRMAATQVLQDDADGVTVQASLMALAREYRGSAPNRGRLMEALLASILILLARIVRAPAPAPAARPELGKAAEHFNRFCQLIELRYTEQRPISWYADQLAMTSAHLNSLCRQVARRSALELVHERVMLEAKRNLVYTSMTVSVVAHELGFADPAYFTRFFKRQAGVAPLAFRRRAGQ